jgi:hypothetical protein
LRDRTIAVIIMKYTVPQSPAVIGRFEYLS